MITNLTLARGATATRERWDRQERAERIGFAKLVCNTTISRVRSDGYEKSVADEIERVKRFLLRAVKSYDGRVVDDAE